MADEIKTVVTERAKLTTERQLEQVEVITMPWWQIIGVRFLRVYLQSLVGFLTANTTGLTEAVTGIPMEQFGNQLGLAAQLALAPAVLTLIQNGIELLAKLDQRAPQMRA